MTAPVLAPPLAADTFASIQMQPYIGIDNPLQAVETLRAQLFREMERLASDEAHAPCAAIPNALMQTLSALCLVGLHYLLMGCGSAAELTTWVAQARLVLHRTRAITTHFAQQEHFAPSAQVEVCA